METGEEYYHSVGYGYDTINNLTAVNETINGITFTTSYAYDMDNRVTSVTSGGTERTYTYDAYSRITQRITKQGEAEILKQTLTYKDGPDTDPNVVLTTGQVHELTNDAAGYDKTYEYTYDGNGNIQTVFDGTYTTRYVYDTANQLIRENNQELGKTWTWTYDAAGNIVNRKEYTYSTADDDELGTPTDTVLYGYTDATWGDLLTSYDGTGIIYDDVGNPLTDGTWTYTWEHGRQLAGLYGEDVNGGLNDVTVTYTYNADGMRTGKTVVTRTYEENAHIHEYTRTFVSPTCTEQGYTLYTCACGDSYKSNYADALGHNVIGLRCTRCGKIVGGGTPITPITPPGIGTSGVSEEVVTQSTTTRVLKSTQTVTYKYVYNGGSLSQMVVTTTTNDGDPTTYVLNFQYDASGTPMSMVINGSEKLYYVTNLQGDVVALLNESGNEVAEYTYSAYGEINSHFYVTGTNNIVGAMFNPLKYRGYVHDIETGWYYLQSRYYDPEIGRFLNADAFASTGQGFEGNNMFAYCLNNPVVLADDTGNRATNHICAVAVDEWVYIGPNEDLAAITDIDFSYGFTDEEVNCFGLAIGKSDQVILDYYPKSNSLQAVVRRVKKLLGYGNVRILQSIDSPLREGEYMVAIKTNEWGAAHFVRLIGNEWYSKSAKSRGVALPASIVNAATWDSVYEKLDDGSLDSNGDGAYNSITVFVAIREDWSRR